MNSVTLFDFSWTCYNGYILTILNIESHKPVNMDSALFAVNVCRTFLYVDILFFKFKVFDKTKYK